MFGAEELKHNEVICICSSTSSSSRLFPPLNLLWTRWGNVVVSRVRCGRVWDVNMRQILRREPSALFQRQSWTVSRLCCSNLVAWLTAVMCAVKKNKSFIFDMLAVSQDWMERLQGAFHCHFLFFSTQTSPLTEEEEHKEFSVSVLKDTAGLLAEILEQNMSFRYFQCWISLMFCFCSTGDIKGKLHPRLR